MRSTADRKPEGRTVFVEFSDDSFFQFVLSYYTKGLTLYSYPGTYFGKFLNPLPILAVTL
jgi:hypothetical protein